MSSCKANDNSWGSEGRIVHFNDNPDESPDSIYAVQKGVYRISVGVDVGTYAPDGMSCVLQGHGNFRRDADPGPNVVPENIAALAEVTVNIEGGSPTSTTRPQKAHLLVWRDEGGQRGEELLDKTYDTNGYIRL